LSTLLDRLREDDDELWKPEKPNDAILGTVVGRRTHDGEYGPSEVITLESPDGTRRAFFAGSSVLSRQIAEADPQVGDLLGVRYKGIAKNRRTGREYKDFRTVCEHRNGRSPDAPSPSTPPDDTPPPATVTARGDRIPQFHEDDPAL
jgi:hypothetical protein